VNGYLKPPKKKSIGQVPILFELEPLLKEWKLQCPSPKWLFPGRKGMPMNAGHWARKNFKEILRMLDLPLVRFHSLRHAFDVMMHDLGVPTREIMQMMGHKNLKMTLGLYDRASIEHLVKVTHDVRFLGSAFLRNSLRNRN